jgi:hypothetical protein
MEVDFVERLRNNAYGTLDVSTHKLDLQGWMVDSFTSVFSHYVHAHARDAPITVIEVGSWKGLSTSTMARICKEYKRDVRIIAVDTWLGAPEFWTWGIDDPDRGGSLKFQQGYPTVFHTFTKNMKALHHDDVIAPLPLPSLCAADVLRHYNIFADVIYIDAAHEYESVKSDIDAYWPLLKSGGMMFGDDYSVCWPGVKQAVDEKAPARSIIDIIWSVYKE